VTEEHKQAAAALTNARAESESAKKIANLTAAETAAAEKLRVTTARYEPLIDAEKALQKSRLDTRVGGWLRDKLGDWKTKKDMEPGKWTELSTWKTNPFTWPRRIARLVTGGLLGGVESTFHTAGQMADSFADGQMKAIYNAASEAEAGFIESVTKVAEATKANNPTRAAKYSKRAESYLAKLETERQRIPGYAEATTQAERLAVYQALEQRLAGKPGVFNTVANVAGQVAQPKAQPVADLVEPITPSLEGKGAWGVWKTNAMRGLTSFGAALGIFGAYRAHTSEDTKADRAAGGLRGGAAYVQTGAADVAAVTGILSLFSWGSKALGAWASPLMATVGTAEFLAAREAGDNERAAGAAGSVLGGLLAGAGMGAGVGAVTANPLVIGGAAVVGGVAGAFFGEKAARAQAENIMAGHEAIVSRVSNAIELDRKYRPYGSLDIPGIPIVGTITGTVLPMVSWYSGSISSGEMDAATQQMSPKAIEMFKNLSGAEGSDGKITGEAVASFLESRGYVLSTKQSAKSIDREADGVLSGYDLYLILDEIQKTPEKPAMQTPQTNAQAAVAALSANGALPNRMAVANASTTQLGAVIPSADMPAGSNNNARTPQDSVAAAFFA
jgi:hypothetical protein